MTALEHEQWGPNGVAVERVVRRARRLTDDEVRRLASAWHAWTAPEPAEGPLDFGDTEPWMLANRGWIDAEDALDETIYGAGRVVPVNDARRAARVAVKDAGTGIWLRESSADPVAAAGRPAAWMRALPLADHAATTAAMVAAVVDLAGTGGSFTIDHVNMLLGPWRAVVELVGEPVCECGPSPRVVADIDG